MRLIRVAICQIESHPAIYTSHLAYLEEPFVPKDGSLSKLGTQGVNVQHLQTNSLRKYIDWQSSRILGILEFLGRLTPTPDLVLFPEGSITIQGLPRIAERSAETGAVVLAGSHTPLQNPDAKRIYDEIGLVKEDTRRIFKTNTRNALPIIALGKTKVIPKRLKSVFETSLVESHAQCRHFALRPSMLQAKP